MSNLSTAASSAVTASRLRAKVKRQEQRALNRLFSVVVRRKISKWARIRKSAVKTKVDNALQSWISSWTIGGGKKARAPSPQQQLEQRHLPKRRGDMHIVRFLFEQIDAEHREAFNVEELARYFQRQAEDSPEQEEDPWPQRRVRGLFNALCLTDKGEDAFDEITWVDFARVIDVLDLFHQPFEVWKQRQRQNIKNKKKSLRSLARNL